MIGDKYLGETLALANHLVFDCLLPEKKKIPRTIVMMDNDTLAGKKNKKIKGSFSLFVNETVQSSSLKRLRQKQFEQVSQPRTYR